MYYDNAREMPFARDDIHNQHLQNAHHRSIDKYPAAIVDAKHLPEEKKSASPLRPVIARSRGMIPGDGINEIYFAFHDGHSMDKGESQTYTTTTQAAAESCLIWNERNL